MRLTNDSEAQMRGFEWLSQIKVPPQQYIVLRLDGKGFSKFTANRFEKPFDERMSTAMVATMMILMEEFGAVYGYTESDEMSVLLPAKCDLYDREVEKLVSISAATVATAFVLTLIEQGIPPKAKSVGFDSRVWCAERTERVVEYFQWRQADALRCGLNAWAYWTLRKQGKTDKVATATLMNKGTAFKNELLFQAGINYARNVPVWQKRGVGVYYEQYQKPGVNPKTNAPAVGLRRRLKIDRELPEKDNYSQLITTVANGKAV